MFGFAIKSARYIFRLLAGELLISNLVIIQLHGHKPKGVRFGHQKSLVTSITDNFCKNIKKSKVNLRVGFNIITKKGFNFCSC